MEIFNLYSSISDSWGYINFARSNPANYMVYPMLDWKTLVISLCIAVAIFAALFILQGIGIYQQSKAKGLKGAKLAFVPFANLLLLEKLSSECSFFGKKMRRADLWTMIAEIVCFLLGACVVFCQVYLYATAGAPQLFSTGTLGWSSLQGFEKTVYNIYNIISIALPIAQLVCEVLLFVLFLGYFRNYKPRNASFLAIIVLFIPVARYIMVFIFRKEPAINYEAYVRQQREAYERRYQAYGNPYGPYTQKNPTASNPTESEPKQPAEEPFAEFDEKADETKGGSSGEGGDDWFN